MSNGAGMKFGYFTMGEIYYGRWWALITSAFVHVEPMHIFFNMYWLWILGPVIERQFGALNFLAFILGTAFVSSGWQIATSHGGIGFSGVGYAIIGFGWLAREKYPNLRPYFSDRTLQIFAGWAVLCVFLDYFNIQHIGNVAHIMGAASGALVALAFIRKQWIAQVGLLLVAGAAIIPVYYSPLSAQWNFEMGYKATVRRDLDSAIRYYHQCIIRGYDSYEPWYNIALIEGQRGHTAEYKTAIKELRRIKPSETAGLVQEFGDPK